MEKILKYCNIYFVLITLLVTISSVILGTLRQLKKEHDMKSYTVVTKRITEGALQCILDQKCEDKTMTLESLINKGYVHEEFNPITKQLFSKNSIIVKHDNTYVLEIR